MKRKDYVCINVSGMMFETFERTLARFPSTLLGNQQRREIYHDRSRNAYFFNRNRQCFDAILFYYQSGGILFRPPDVPLCTFVKEIVFFDLGKEAVASLQRNEGYGEMDADDDLPSNPSQRKLWQLFEYPDSTIGANVLAFCSIIVITLSVITFCIESMPVFKDRKELNELWSKSELLFITWFSVEYILRLLSSPDKCKFLLSALNFIDVVTIIPYFMSLHHTKITFPVLRFVRHLRVLRIFKLTRHSLGLQAVGEALKRSIREIAMFTLFLLLGVVLFSGAMYYAERIDSHMFMSIPDACWYSIITMTTVGYGDKWPHTLVGRLIGTLCVLCGVLTIGLPIPVIANKFEHYYNRARMASSMRAFPVISGERCEEGAGSSCYNKIKSMSPMNARPAGLGKLGGGAVGDGWCSKPKEVYSTHVCPVACDDCGAGR